MRRTSIFLALAASSIAGAVACTGGVGALPAFTDGWEEDTGERNRREVPTNGTEPAPSTQEGAASQLDPSPGSGGGAGAGGLVCSGVYACTVVSKGQTVTVNIQLVEKDGQCTANDAILMPDGTIKSTKDGGGTEGTWSGGGNTIVVTTEDGSVTCVRTNGSGGGTSTGGTNGSGGSGGGSVPDVPPPVTDAGTVRVDAG